MRRCFLSLNFSFFLRVRDFPSSRHRPSKWKALADKFDVYYLSPSKAFCPEANQRSFRVGIRSSRVQGCPVSDCGMDSTPHSPTRAPYNVSFSVASHQILFMKAGWHVIGGKHNAA